MRTLTMLLILLILAACSPSEAAIQTAISQTQAALPTNTNSPTNTSSPTITPTLTNTTTPTKSPTLTKTATKTKTKTPTPTNTATLEPPTALTQKAKNEFATGTALSKTTTAEAKAATATEIATYISIPRKDLVTYPENYIGTKVYVRGRVFNILGNVIQIYFSGTYDALYVNLAEAASGIYENDIITVYGIVKGKECFTNRLGGSVCQPALINGWYPEQLVVIPTETLAPTFTLTPTKTPTSTLTFTPTLTPTSTIAFLSSMVILDGDLPVGYYPGDATNDLPEAYSDLPIAKYPFYQEFVRDNNSAGGIAIIQYGNFSTADIAYNLIKKNMEGSTTSDISGDGVKGYAISYDSTSTGGLKVSEILFLQCNSVIHIRLIGTDDINTVISYFSRLHIRFLFSICT